MKSPRTFFTIFLGWTLFIFGASWAMAGVPPDSQRIHGIRMPFIQNQGQVHPEVSFFAQTFGGTVYVTQKGAIVYALAGAEKTQALSIKESFFQANSILCEGQAPSPTRVNFFIGRDKKKWKRNVPTFNSLDLGSIYEGITLTLQASGNNVEKIFTITPGARPEQIQVKLTSAEKITVTHDGELSVQTPLGPVTFSRPVAFQEIDGKKVPVPVKYVAQHDGYAFSLGNYDRSRQLIIDPMLSTTYFLGDTSEDFGGRSLIKAGDLIYVTGGTFSTNFPAFAPGYDDIYNNGGDAFVSRFSEDLTFLETSTFIGGSALDEGAGLFFDDGFVFLTGITSSNDFPAAGGFDDTHNGAKDAFLVVFTDEDLTDIEFSTYIGGSGDDTGLDVEVYDADFIYVLGNTDSSDFPTGDGNGYDTAINGTDTFVALFDFLTTNMETMTFLGGSGSDYGHGLSVDSSGNVYVAGHTDSSDFTMTGTPYQSTKEASRDIFICQLGNDLTTQDASTFFGGGGDDSEPSIFLSGSDVFISGRTDSSGFPASPTYQSANLGNGDVIVAKFNSALSSLSASALLGGSGNEHQTGGVNNTIFIHGGDVFVTGSTMSDNFPTTSDADFLSRSGDWDVFVSRLDGDLTTLKTSTYIGGNNEDRGFSIVAADSATVGNVSVYIAGDTRSSDFPPSPNPNPEMDGQSFHGSQDVFVSLLDMGPPPAQPDVQLVSMLDDPDPVAVTGTISYTITVKNNGPVQADSVTLQTGAIPTGATFIYDPAYPCLEGSGAVACTLGNMADGAQETIIIKLMAPASTGSITFDSQVSSTSGDSDPTNNSASADTLVESSTTTNLSVTKSDDVDPVVGTQTVTYTVIVTNNGPATATGVTVTDQLIGSSGAQFLTYVSNKGSCSESMGTVTCNINDLANTESATVTIEVQAPSSATPTTITDQATVSSTTIDPDTSDNTASENTQVTPPADLEIQKGCASPAVPGGSILRYIMTVTNNGAANANGVTVTDTLSDKLSYDSSAPEKGSCSFDQPSNTVTCNIGSMAASESVEIITMATSISVLTETDITNEARVTGSNADPDNTNNMASCSVTLLPVADIGVEKSDQIDPVTSGENIKYSVTVTNHGPAEATAVTLTDTLPSGTSFVSGGTTAVTCNSTVSAITCDLGDMAASEVITLPIVITSPLVSSSQMITNTVSVTTTQSDTNSSNDSADENTQVDPAEPDLAVTSMDMPDPVQGGSVLTYTIKITNIGSADAPDVELNCGLDPETAYISANTATNLRQPEERQPSCLENSGTVTCDLDTLGVNDEATIEVKVKAPVVSMDTDITATGNVTTSGNDSDSGNDSFTETTTVLHDGSIPTIGQWGGAVLVFLLTIPTLMLRHKKREKEFGKIK